MVAMRKGGSASEGIAIAISELEVSSAISVCVYGRSSAIGRFDHYSKYKELALSTLILCARYHS